MTEGDRVFEEKFPGKNVLEVFPMKGDETACPKCDLQFKNIKILADTNIIKHKLMTYFRACRYINDYLINFIDNLA